MNFRAFLAAGAIGLVCFADPNWASGQTNRTWNGSASTDWFNPNNWTPAGVPATNDIVNFTNSGFTIDLTAPVTINGQFNWSGGTLSGNPLTIATNGALDLSGNNLMELEIALTNAGTVTWTGNGGYLAVVYGTNFGEYGRIENLPGGLWDIQATSVTIAGTSDTNGGFHNAGTVQFQGGGSYTLVGTFFANAGTVTMLQGTLFQFDGGGTLAGTFSAAAGTTVDFSGGSFVCGPVPVLDGPGVFELTGGTLTLLDDAPLNLLLSPDGTVSLGPNFQGGTITNLTLSGSTLIGSSYTVSGELNWGAGTILAGLTVAGGATVNWAGGYAVGPLNVASNGVLNIGGNNNKNLQNALTNAGTVTWTGGGPVYLFYDTNNGFYGQILNVAGGQWNIQVTNNPYSPGSPVSILNANANGGTNAYFYNAGVVQLQSPGEGLAAIGIPFYNFGAVALLQGTLSLNAGGTLAGTFNAAAGATNNFSGGNFTYKSVPVLDGPGVSELTGGTLTLLNDVIPNLQLGGGTISLGPNFQGGTITNLTLSGGTLAGTNTLTGVMNWIAGSSVSISTIAGPLTIASSGVLNLDSSGVGGRGLFLQSTLTNTGTVNWLGGELTVGNNCPGPAGLIVNQAGALWNIQCDQSMFNLCSGASFENAGTVQKSAGTGTTALYVSFTNSGTLSVQRGTVWFEGGSPAYTQTGATMNFGLSGANNAGQVFILGNVNFDGTLGINLLNGYVPHLGDSISLITYSSHTGAFDNLSLSGLGANLAWQVSYSASALALKVVPNANSTAQITGSVTDTLSHPVTNITVIAYTTNSTNLYVSGSTDANGNYALDVPNGNWLAGVQGLLARGYSSVPVQSVTVSNANQVVNFVVQPYGSQTFTITTAVNPAEGGTASGGGTFPFGTVVTVTATAITNSLPYSFLDWTENGAFQSASTSYSFPANQDRQLVANFTLPSYTISASNNPSAAGTITGAGSYFYAATNVLAAIPNFGYNFSYWTEGTNIVGTNLTLTTVVYSNHFFVANYADANLIHVVTTATSPGGLAAVAGAGTYTNGQTANFSAPPLVTNPPNLYTFLEYTVSNVLASTNASFSKTFSTTDATNLQYVAVYGGTSLLPPVISKVATTPGQDQCAVTWSTDKPATSQVEYGLTSLYGSLTPLSAPLVTNHSVTVTGLNPNTLYHFRVHSIDAEANEGISSEGSFTTLPAPDLQVVSVSLPQQGWTGRPFDVSWVLTNAGMGVATGPWEDRVYLSATDQLRTNLDQVLGDFAFEGQLAPGQTVQLIHPVTINRVGITNGPYYVSVLTDASNNVFEVTKTNNVGISSSNLYVQLTALPALTVASADAPASGLGGQPVEVSWMVCNQGQADTEVPVWYDHLYLSMSTNLAGVVADYGEFENPSYLAVSGCYEQPATVTLPVGISGPFYFVVNADATGALNQDDITNNLGSTLAPMDVQLVTPGFLHVVSVQVAPAPPTAVWAGESVTVTWTVENIGQTPIFCNDPNGFDDEVTLSPTPVYDFVHGYWDVINHQYFAGPFPLAPGQSYSHTNSFTVPQGITPGNWYAVPIVNTHYFATGDGAPGSSNIGRDQNSALVLVSSPLPSDLEVASVSAPDVAYAGQSINIGWVVSNEGLNVTSSDFWYDGVFLSTNGGFDINQNLLLGSVPHWGALDIGASYTNDVSLLLPASVVPLNASSVTNYLFVYTDTGNSVLEITKTNNVLEAPGPLTVLPAPPPALADLAVTSVSAPSTVLAGGPAGVFWTVTNQGPGTTDATNWLDSVYLSPDGSFDPAVDTWLADIPHDGPLAPGVAYNVGQNISIPYCAIGSYFVVVVTDSGHQVNEGGATKNNIMATAKAMRILANGAARLEVSAVSSATSISAGASLSVSWTVANSGRATTNAPWVDGVYLSPSPQYVPGSGYLLGVYTAQTNLGSGASYGRSQSYIVPPCFSGTYYVTVVTDLSNIVDSVSCYTNNFRTAPAPVQVAPVAYPSLQVAGMALPSAVTSAVPWMVQWSVTNAGPGEASGTWFDAIYASMLPALDPSAFLLGQFEHNGGLPAGGSYFQSQLVQTPACTLGQYYIFAVADVSNVVNVAASCQVNNPARSTDALAVNSGLYPDLAVTAVSVPATANGGQSMTLSWTVTNSGLATANGPWLDAIYLSIDRSVNLASDLLLGSYPQTSPLAPGATYTQTASFIVPEVYGNAYVAVFPDATNALQECQNQTNNVALSAGTVNIQPAVYPELKVTTVQVPRSALAGQPITVSWVVTNDGTAPAGPGWYDAVFLSTDEVLDLYAVRLGTFADVRSLGVGQSYTNSATIVVPPGNAGPFYILVLADSGGVLFEPLGYNDSLGWDPDAILVTLPPTAQLAPSNVTLAPATGVPGTPTTIGWTVTNVSTNNTASTWADAVYLSTNNFWDIAATFLTNVNHTGLAASAGYNGSWSGPLPALTPGSYYAIARADVRDSVPESTLSNLVGVSPNTILVDVPVLVLGQTITNQLTTGAAQYYKVNCPAGQTVRISLVGASTNSANELYVRFGAVPDLGNYDFIYSNVMAPNQEIDIPTTQAGWYYIMVRGGPSSYTLAANIVPFAIGSVTPKQIGDNGQVTLTVSGAKFQPGATAQLVSGANSYFAETNIFVDGTTVQARFIFTNAIHGIYDVVLTDPGNQPTTATQAVTIETALSLTAQVIPGLINFQPRVGLPFNWAGLVANAGNVDIPYLTVGVALSQRFPIALTPPLAAVAADTDSTDNPAGACVFIARDIPPGGSLDFSFVVSGFGANAFSYYIVPTPQSKEDFLQEVVDGAEDLREFLTTNADTLTFATTNISGIITTNSSSFPPWLATALSNTNGWANLYAQSLVMANLLDTNDLVALPPPSSKALTSTPSLRVRPKDLSCEEECETAVKADKEAIWVTFFYETFECVALGVECSPGGPASIALCFGLCEIKPVVMHVLEDRIIEDFEKVCTYQCTPGGPGGPGGPSPTPGWPVTPRPPKDPNEKQGPAGYSAASFVGSQVPWQYTIYFENTSNALAFARQVSITDVLDPSLDIRTFRVGQIVLGNVTIAVPTNRTYYQTRIPLPPPNPSNVVADITAGVDVQSGSLFWTMNAIDLNTGQLVTDTQEGVLPPNTTNNIGAGYATYSIKPAAGVPTGRLVANQASIVFDTNDPLATNPTTNTVDAVPPTSFVAALPAVINTSTFTVAWAGTDDAGGSGVASFTILFSDNGGPYQVWLANTTSTSAQFTGQFGHTYAFYSAAQDHSGNIEAAHTTPDTTTLVSSPPVIAPVADQTVNVGTAVIITNTVSEADQPAPALAYSLGPNAPAGAAVNPTNGVFTWTPECAQGSTTNLIEVLVTASDNPGVPNSIWFNVVVGDCVQVIVGSTVVLSGQSATIPVNLFSTVGLTNLTFTLDYPSNRFTNWTISATNPVGSTGAAQMLGPSNTLFGITTLGGQVLQGPTLAGSITFSALPSSSAFIPLAVTGVTGTKADGSPVGNISGQSGRVVVIGPEPLLEAWLSTNLQRMLTIYGAPGASYEVDYSTNLFGANWQYAWRVPMTNLFEAFAANESMPQVFYRAFEFSANPPILELNSPAPSNMVLLLYGPNGANYRIISGTNLLNTANWTSIADFRLTNSFQSVNAGAATNRIQFFRAKQQ